MTKLILKGMLYHPWQGDQLGSVIARIVRDLGVRHVVIEVHENFGSTFEDAGWTRRKREIERVINYLDEAGADLYAISIHGPHPFNQVYPYDKGIERHSRTAIQRSIELANVVGSEFTTKMFYVLHPARFVKSPHQLGMKKLKSLHHHFLDENRTFVQQVAPLLEGTLNYEVVPPINDIATYPEMPPGGICGMTFDDLRYMTEDTPAQAIVDTPHVQMTRTFAQLMGDTPHTYQSNRFHNDRQRERLLKELFPDSYVALKGTQSPEVVSPPDDSTREMGRQTTYVHIADGFMTWNF